MRDNIVSNETYKKYNTIRLYRLYRRIYCVHCCCAGRVLKRCRDRIRRPRLKTKKVRIADRPEKIIWEPKRIDIYRGIGGVGACGAENILYSMCVCVCIILYTILYYVRCTYLPIQEILYFYAFQCDRCGGRRHYNNNNNNTI